MEPADGSDFVNSSRGILATLRSRIFQFPPGTAENIPGRGRGFNVHARLLQLLAHPSLNIVGRLARLDAGIGFGHDLVQELVRVALRNRDTADLLRLRRLRQVHLR